MQHRRLREQIYRESWQASRASEAGDVVNLADIHPNDRVDLVIHPGELYAERGDATVTIERLTEMPNDWLREHGCPTTCGLPEARPVVVMLYEDGEQEQYPSDVVAFFSDCDTELADIDRAVAALQLARDALVSTGYRDRSTRGVAES